MTDPSPGAPGDYMRSILDRAHEAFVAMDAAGVVDWTPQAQRTFGWTREEAIGRVLAELFIPAGDREAHRRGLHACPGAARRPSSGGAASLCVPLLRGPLCVALFDLDHFKHYNDAHGHQAGDELLREIAHGWCAQLRASDILARYGEEFALLCPARPQADVLAVVERLRACLPAGQTCSAGLTASDGAETAAALVGRADTALYRAKAAGRDRTVTAD